MSLFKKLFGQKSVQSKSDIPSLPAAIASPSPSDPSEDPNLIRVHDAYGREMFITKAQWRDSILLGHIKKVWNNPTELGQIIIQSLHDGFVADMVAPAKHLVLIDPDPERSHVLLAVTYLQLKRYDDAEKILQRFFGKHDETGSALTNLAKVYSGRGDDARALETLWRGLTLDPNQENGLGWYEVIHREKAGPAAGLEAYRRVAALPGAWRARLWLARDRLDQRDLPAALALYAEALACAPRPIPADLLVQLSGDLGNHAHLPEILQLAEPHVDLAFHGLKVGNNLIKAHLDLGQLDAARVLVDRLYALKRPDWQQTLAFWDTEIAKARTAVTAVGLPAAPKVAFVMIDGPLWLGSASCAAKLLSPKPADAVVVACLGSTFTRADASSGAVRLQMSDIPGRISRALPLYLAEQLHLRTDGIGRVLQPWVQEGSGSFVLTGVAWSDEQAISHARGGSTPADYIAVVAIDGTVTPWTATLRFIRTIDGALLGTFAVHLTSERSQPGFDELVAGLLSLVTKHAQMHPVAAPDFYEVPGGADFAAYQLRLEQLLAVSFAATDGLTTGFLSGEREIIGGNLQLCLNHPQNPTPRLLLAQSLRHLQKIRPDVVTEFKDKLALLQKEKPLAEPMHSMVQQAFSEVLAG
jgi:tetratricopeptide (TPR) repeat protein